MQILKNKEPIRENYKKLVEFMQPSNLERRGSKVLVALNPDTCFRENAFTTVNKNGVCVSLIDSEVDKDGYRKPIEISVAQKGSVNSGYHCASALISKAQEGLLEIIISEEDAKEHKKRFLEKREIANKEIRDQTKSEKQKLLTRLKELDAIGV